MKPNLRLCAATVAIVMSLQLFKLGPIPGSQNLLRTSEILQLTGAVGPESLAFDPNGDGPYTGVADGRILKWDPNHHRWTDFAVTTSQRKECVRPFAPELEHVCGRPLGLRFNNKTGDLYIADAYLGLQVVGPAGGLASQVVKEVEGQQLHFTNDIDIDEKKDVIYFTDSSTVFHRRQFMSSILNGDKTGRLLKYNISSQEVVVLLRGLAFANGVALSKDHSFVLVAETTNCRILRHWLYGPNAGDTDIFTKLPGFPDNIRRNSKGLFAKWLVSNTWAGKSLLKLPLGFKRLHSLLVGGKAYATAIKLSEKGDVLQVLEDCEGKSMRFISEVDEKDGKLWMGSVLMPFIGIYNL
ncbi:hypothetical protein ACLB2K_066267 [Fragaria x ananassa]